MANYNIPQDVPVYRILDPKGFYAEDFLYPQGSVVIWEETPNEQMEPLNAMARDALTAYLDELDACAKLVAEKTGKTFRGRDRGRDGAIAIATLESRRPQLVEGDGGIPLMQGKRSGPKRARLLEPESDTVKFAPRGKRSLESVMG